ncbi:MAG: hypothetical protein J0L94_12460 [Rhodothermia bacterium]|nr:hypothetical protein [Rhodothermia bacterium]
MKTHFDHEWLLGASFVFLLASSITVFCSEKIAHMSLFGVPFNTAIWSFPITLLLWFGAKHCLPIQFSRCLPPMYLRILFVISVLLTTTICYTAFFPQTVAPFHEIVGITIQALTYLWFGAQLIILIRMAFGFFSTLRIV